MDAQQIEKEKKHAQKELTFLLLQNIHIELKNRKKQESRQESSK